MNASTPFTDVNTIQSNEPTAAHAASRGPSSRGGAIRIIGASIGSAPNSASRSTSAAACARGLVTSTRLPESGRASNQRSGARRRELRPTTRTAVALSATSRAAACTSRSVPSTARCPGSVPCRTRVARSAGDHPWRSSSSPMRASLEPRPSLTSVASGAIRVRSTVRVSPVAAGPHGSSSTASAASPPAIATPARPGAAKCGGTPGTTSMRTPRSWR